MTARHVSLSHSERNIKAVGGPHGGVGPSRIHALHLGKLEIQRKSELTLPGNSAGVLIYRYNYFLNIDKNVDDIMISIPIQVSIKE